MLTITFSIKPECKECKSKTVCTVQTQTFFYINIKIVHKHLLGTCMKQMISVLSTRMYLTSATLVSEKKKDYALKILKCINSFVRLVNSYL